MKKTYRRLLFSGLALSMLFFLSGCVQTKNGKPTGEGWVYNLLVEPMGNVIKYLANDLGIGFGFAIIIVTIVVRLLILPLGLSQVKKMTYQTEKMAYLKPVFEPIQERMKKAQTQEEKMAAQTELMEAQRHYGISMFGGFGCLPILIQMPFFSALFYATRYTQGISSHSFLGINLGEPSLLITVIIGILYFVQSWLSTRSVSEAQQQQMKGMMLVMPLMMVVISMGAPAGGALYWLISGIFGLIQQLLTNHIIKPKLRQQIDEEFEKNPPKAFKSNTRKDVTPKKPANSQAITAPKKHKSKRNAGKQRSRK
ncbi:membrane protein insertase YidC [Streptococcus ratti]|uniref:Membrane protein insertase YidC n=1 Tax=Streptococcus ratti FA-1 = DSM 20564 TaxID=699248 RepID=A0ABN0GSN7_STRRT|nr:membrane protein insertase YidC [Streptococcus ratti]EJN93295.1 OxaA-like protein precursor [Streptococcus ratti FA-1 = DSM 20564]EMP68616.1 OxaA-like protein precursor [Streptococcus ratti FA-1 = DSM 20564]QEY07195.1 membrane protein insertase YidC [Streptococcus ratti]VEI59627.1 OxaA-like protein precursor [Streptococcus mutans]